MYRRTPVGALFSLLFFACGEVATVRGTEITPDAATPDAASMDASARDASADANDANADDGGSCAGEGTADLTWKGTPIYVIPTTYTDTKDGVDYPSISGGIFDPEFRVDEGVLAFDLPRGAAPGTYKCVKPEDFSPTGTEVVVVFAEHRGFVFSGDPSSCSVTIRKAEACGHYQLSFRAEYDSTYYGRVPIAGTVESFPR